MNRLAVLLALHSLRCWRSAVAVQEGEEETQVGYATRADGFLCVGDAEAANKLLSTQLYMRRMPLIPEAELLASSRRHPLHPAMTWLLHTRRVPTLPPPRWR